jgi:hypothetical protein
MENDHLSICAECCGIETTASHSTHEHYLGNMIAVCGILFWNMFIWGTIEWQPHFCKEDLLLLSTNTNAKIGKINMVSWPCQF